jgi:serine protease Do
MKKIRLTLGCCVALLLLIIAGCATPQVKVWDDFSYEKSKAYKKLYLIKGEDDSRNILPIVKTKLREIGFDVEEAGVEDSIGGSQGSGFVIHPDGYILTCAHVVENEKKATVWLQSNRFDADVVYKDVDKDLALLKLADNKTPLPSLAFDFNGDYKMGQDVYTIGFPLSSILGNSPRLNKGLLSSTVGLKDDPDFLQVSTQIQPGNSGSPLLNDKGVVVGVMQSTLNPLSVMQRTGGGLPQNVNFALKTHMIREFADNCPENIPLKTDTPQSSSFEDVKNSVAQIYAGVVTEEFLKQPKIVCVVAYHSIWDMWYRFAIFNIDFYDLETGDHLLRAGQYGDNMLSTEKKVIDQTFAEIKSKFFPGG